MTKKEIKILLDDYKENYRIYKMDLMKKREFLRIRNMIELVIDDNKIIEKELEVIFNDNDYMMKRWKLICEMIDLNNIYRFNKLEWIKLEIGYYSDSEEQFKARLNIITKFEKRILDNNEKYDLIA